jgi:hypothetical protein
VKSRPKDPTNLPVGISYSGDVELAAALLEMGKVSSKALVKIGRGQS